MFGRKRLRQENAALAQRADSLESELTAIRADPSYPLAQQLHAEIQRTTPTPDQVQALLAKLRAEKLAERSNELAAAEVAKTLAGQRAIIEAQAQKAAIEAARLAVQAFQENDADAYRAALESRLTEQKTAAGLAAARFAIRDEVTGNAVSGVPLDREGQKARAKTLRERTKNTSVLQLAWLKDGEQITLGFTEKGRGHDLLTAPGMWSRSYDRSLEMRKITFELMDVEHGIARVAADSWFEDSDHREQSIRAGKHVIIGALDPESEQTRPVLIKGAAVDIENVDGQACSLPDDLELWWVDIGEFRAMS